MRLVLCILALVLVSGFGCSSKHELTPAFYFWKTRYALTQADQRNLRLASAQKLYLRFFDVDWDAEKNRALPRATIEFEHTTIPGVQYVPVVFITQRCLNRLSDSNAAGELAENIAALLRGLCGQSNISPAEVQIDCDWTAGSRERYFALLRVLRGADFLRGKTISATIRMHQVKYVGKSGVPPVDRGMLMCYNMGNTRKPGTHNSILDADEAEDYLTNIDAYPLSLDVALPLFRWCLLFRNGIFLGIMREVLPEEVARVSFLKKEGSLYRSVADTSWQGYAIQKGDIIRAETPSSEDIRRIASFTARRISNKRLTVALYHLDSLTCAKYSPDELESFFAPYR